MTPREALYWNAEDNCRVQCNLCPHRCRISENTSGICGVRENRGGKLIASGYGIVSSAALDPIEKKPLYKFHPGKKILSIGGFGCNLKCPFCQNYEISAGKTGDGSLSYRWQDREPSPVLPQDILHQAVQTVPAGNIGVAYTYNEPLIGYEFVSDCAVLVREAGLCNVLVTNGYINKEPLEAILPFIDAMNIDLKGFTDGFYSMTGGKLEPVKEAIELARAFCHIEVTTLVITGANENDVEPIAKWLSLIDPDIPLHLTRFFPRYRYSDRAPTPVETVFRLCETARKYLSNVYAGNI